MPDKKPKKIIFITNLDVLGGTENNLVSIVSHPLFMHSFSPCIFSGTRPHPAIMSRLAKTNTRVVQHNTLLGIRIPGSFRNRMFRRHLQKNKPDVVVFWNHVAKSRQLHICKELHLKTVFFERGTGWRDHKPAGMRNFLSEVGMVLSNSAAGRQILASRWGYEGECLVLPNAVRPEIAMECPVVLDPLEKRSLRIGVAARLVAYKGVALAILATRELQDRGLPAELHIAGDGPEADCLRTLSWELDIRTEFYGSVDDMAGFYRKIDILVVPSIREPFGTVAIEAQALGRPVVCSAVDGLPEVVVHGKTGYCIEPGVELEEYLKYVTHKKNMPDMVYFPQQDKMQRPKALDPVKIASAIEDMAADPGKIVGMSRSAAALAKERFDFNGYMREMVRVLGES